MSNQIVEFIDYFNTEAESLGLPTVRADLPLSDQKPSILLSLGELSLESQHSFDVLRLRRAFDAFLKAENIQVALEKRIYPCLNSTNSYV